jgi:hypothetical protein
METEGLAGKETTGVEARVDADTKTEGDAEMHGVLGVLRGVVVEDFGAVGVTLTPNLT